jgi:hypothetical protein
MDATNTANTALNQLQTRDQTELLDAVDRLRQDGFAGELSLPQLIVVGDQSSGKSSVLEAISRVHFPCADGFGTSFATELVLRNSATQSFSVKIVPAEDRPPTDKQTLSGFRSNQDLNDLRNFPNVVNAATQCIKSVPSSQDKACFKDRLIAHVSRPDLPPLTLVDLPGFIHSDNEDQGADDVDTIKQLALSYMSQKNSIMLPIVSMENQIALQVVLSHTRTLDKTGKRTLGIITKPDRVDSGTTLEAKGIECAKNQNIYFELGWHVLLNRDHKTRDISSEERDAREAQFFSDLSDWNWKVLPASDVGVAALRQKLSGILLNSIRVNLPTLIGDIKQRVQQCESNISKLGKPHETEPEQKTQLSMVSYDLHKLIAEGLKGDYEHPFFHTGDLRVPSTRRIRSRIRDILDSFNVHMETKGHRFAFGPLDSGSRSSGAIFTTNVTASLEVHHPPGPISVRDALDQITSHIKRTRGCELDGTLPLGIKGEIFRHLCSRWFFIAEIYALQCWDAVSSFLCQAALHVAPSHVANHVLCHELMPAMENMKREMVSKVRALCAPYTSGKTITLNHEYFNSVRLQQEHCLYGLYLFEDADNAESTDDDWSGKAEGTDHSTGTEACNNTSLATSTGDPQQPSKISLGVSDRQAFDVLVQAQAYYHVGTLYIGLGPVEVNVSRYLVAVSWTTWLFLPSKIAYLTPCTQSSILHPLTKWVATG